MTEAMSPDCLIAQGTESNEVPIIVFQIAKLKVLMFEKHRFILNSSLYVILMQIKVQISRALNTYVVTSVDDFPSPPRLINLSKVLIGM